MGRAKLLLSWPAQTQTSNQPGRTIQTTVLGRLVQMWREAGAGGVAVVHGAGDEGVCKELDRLGVASRIVNPAPNSEMIDSIRCAARWDGWDDLVTHFAIVLGDQPHLRLETLRSLLDSVNTCPERIWMPIHQGRTGHPVVLPRAEFVRIGAHETGTLRDFLNEKATLIASCEVDDAGLLLDIDRPEDYEAALRLYHSITIVGQTGKRPHSAP